MNTALVKLNCGHNQLTRLNVSNNTLLTSLDVQYNQLVSINVSMNKDLLSLNISHNQITSAILNNSKLTSLYCSDNLIDSLDVHSFADLKTLSCSNNHLSILDVRSNPRLTTLFCSNNQIGEIDISNNTELTVLYCNDNELSALNLSRNTSLKQLYCYNNILNNLDVSHNAALIIINCKNNRIKTFSVANNTFLKKLNISDNELKTLNLTNNIELQELYCNGNQIEDLSLINNTKLERLWCYDNLIENVCIENNPCLITVYDSGEKIKEDTHIKYSLGQYELAVEESVQINEQAITPTAIPTKTPAITSTATPTPEPTSLPTSMPTIKPTTTPTPTTSPKPTATPTPVMLSNNTSAGLGNFIERLYKVALGRPSEAYGKNYWINKVKLEGFTGADVARGFLFSDEFLGKNMSNSDFLDTLYMTFFNRQADEHKADWLTLMDQGWTKMQVIDGFINSTEWANLCLTYGIASGSNCKPNIVIAPSGEVESFARRLYTTCLGRDADIGGLNDWATQLANMQISGSQAAHGFFFSEEFIAHGFSNEEYVNRLYRTFMGREADPAGFADWVGQLNSGVSRESVFQGFAGSTEWAGICAEYGILK